MGKVTTNIIGSSCGGIGDNLIFTPIFRARPQDFYFQMVDHPKSRNVAKLLVNNFYLPENAISFVDKPVGCPENTRRSLHIGQKKLDGLGLHHASCFPYVSLTDKEKEEGKKRIAGIKNPLAIVTDNNGSNDPMDINSAYRRKPLSHVYEYLKNTPQDKSPNGEPFTLVQFGLDSTLEPLPNAIQMRGLGLRELASVYHAIGNYIGIDTGDYHLMLAVGGKCIVFVPPDNPAMGYSCLEWHYPLIDREGNRRKVEYIECK